MELPCSCRKFAISPFFSTAGVTVALFPMLSLATVQFGPGSYNQPHCNSNYDVRITIKLNEGRPCSERVDW